MAWITLLSEEQLEVVVDDVQRYVKLETNSGGAIPSYVTVRFEEPEKIDALIEALSEAKKKLGLF